MGSSTNTDGHEAVQKDADVDADADATEMERLTRDNGDPEDESTGLDDEVVTAASPRCCHEDTCLAFLLFLV